MRNKRLIGILCLMLFFVLDVYAGGLEIGLTGGNWNLGDAYQNQVFSTSGNKWTITGTDDGDEDIFVRVEPDGSWIASDDGNNGPDKFVLRKDNETGLIISTTDVKLASLIIGDTYYFDLWYKAPDKDSTDTGTHNLTVILTAKNWQGTIEDGEWRIMDGDLVRVGTGGGDFLMWPRPRSCPATNNDEKLSYKDEATAGESCWDNLTKTYTFDYDTWCGEGGDCNTNCTKDNYPAFKWAEDLVWKGYDDWRLPTRVELIQLCDYGLSYISYSSNYYSSSENGTSGARAVDFPSGNTSGSAKTILRNVRAVRSRP